MIRLAKKIGRVTCSAAALASLSRSAPRRHRLAPAQDGLGHHDGAIDEDAEVDGAERQQIRPARA